MKNLFKLCLLALPTIAVAQFAPTAKPVPSNLKFGFDSINVAEGKKFLGYLAGPECEGRGTGEPGFEKAAVYMADNFKKMGLKPGMPDGTYFQYNDFWRTRVNPTSLELNIGGISVKGSSVNLVSAGNADVSGTGVLLVVPTANAEGIEAATAGLKGKVVFLLTAGGRNVERAVLRAEPKAIVTIQKEVFQSGWTGRSREPVAQNTPTPRFEVSESSLFGALGSEIQTATTSHMKSSKTAKKWVVSSNVSVKGKQETEKIKVQNVVAWLEGSDPTLKAEYVGIGAHLDHLGKRGNTIYYGADDDGSGCVALLQLAGALAKNPVKPKRSVMFMAFYGEEMGLLGSRFLSDNCPQPIENMVAELQMDMVGRNSSGAQNGDQKRIDKEEENRDTIRLVGSKRISTKLDDLIQEMNQHVGFRFKYDAEDVYTRSDHFNFARKGIPVAFFFSGFHPDYHESTDTIEKINFDKIVNTAKLNYLIIHKLGEFPGRLPKN